MQHDTLVSFGTLGSVVEIQVKVLQIKELLLGSVHIIYLTLFLLHLYHPVIRAGTKAAEGVPEADMIKRTRVSLNYKTFL